MARFAISVLRERKFLGTESIAGSLLSLVGRTGVGKFLCAIPARESVGVGNVLAGRRIFQLDYRAVDSRGVYDERSVSGAARGAGAKFILGVHFRRAVGIGRTHVWADHALSGNVARDGGSAGVHGGIRHVDAADFSRVFAREVLGTRSGLTILVGVGICLLGIVFAGAAGMSKEKEMTEEQKRASIKEFNLKKGLVVATFSGVMSACFAYGLAAGDPIKEITLRHGTPVLWQGLPVLVVVLLGGFTTNFIWCVILNVRNRTGSQYFKADNARPLSRGAMCEILENVTDAPAEEMAQHARLNDPDGCESADALELFFLRACRDHLVFPVFLLHDGRNADGPLQIFQLDAAHGQHHYFQHAMGNRAEGMARSRRANESAGGAESLCSGRVDS